MHITRAFLDGMKETAAQEIHPINVTDRHIEFCSGCFACKYKCLRCYVGIGRIFEQRIHIYYSERAKELSFVFVYALYLYVENR